MSNVRTDMIANSNILALEPTLAMIANNSAIYLILYKIDKSKGDIATNPLGYRVARRLAKALTSKEVTYWFKMNTDKLQTNRFLCYVIHSYDKLSRPDI